MTTELHLILSSQYCEQYSLLRYHRRFVGTYCLHPHGFEGRVKQAANKNVGSSFLEYEIFSSSH
jgi:hypothetical protein